MKRHCACGKAWEGEGACPQCFLLQAVKVERLEEKVGQLQQGFASLVKIAADTPTAAPKPPGIGPLMSAAWRIRQLGKERVEALEKIRSLVTIVQGLVEALRPFLNAKGYEQHKRKAEEILELVAVKLTGEALLPLMPSGPLGEAKENPVGSHTKPIAIKIPRSESGEELDETLGKLRGEGEGPAFACEHCGKDIPFDKGIGGGEISEGRVCDEKCYEAYLRDADEGE